MKSILDINISALHYKDMYQTETRDSCISQTICFKSNKFNQKLVCNILSGNELEFCFSSKIILMASLKKQ